MYLNRGGGNSLSWNHRVPTMPTIKESESFCSMDHQWNPHHRQRLNRYRNQDRTIKSAASATGSSTTSSNTHKTRPQTYTRRAAAAFVQWFTLVSGEDATTTTTGEQSSSSSAFYIIPECLMGVCGTDTLLCGTSSTTNINAYDYDDDDHVAAADILAEDDFSDDDSGNPGLNLYDKGQDSPPYYNSY